MKLWETVQDITNKKRQNVNINEILSKDGNLIKNEKEIADQFNRHYSEIGIEMANKINKPNITFHDNISEKSFHFTPVDNEEIIKHINSLKNFKSPGVDQIKSELIKYCIDAFTPLLTHLINIAFTSGKCPSHFKIAIIKPLFKAGDKLQIINYRPISLISNIAKVFEKAIKSRMETFIKKYDLLSKKQFGFREKTSTEDALANLTNHIYKAIDQKLPSLTVFIDLAKAFDTVSHKQMLSKLWNMGFRGEFHRLLKSYLEDRTQIVKIGNELSDPKNVLIGLPQGTVLAPLLFNIFVNNLLTLPIEGKISAFADDTAIFFSAASWSDLKTITSINMKKVKDWLDYHLLTINVEKTKYMCYTSYKNSLPNYTNIPIHNTNLSINAIESIKYLGVIIDSNLKWHLQINYVVKRLRSLIYCFKQLRNIIDEKELRIIYNGLVQSIIRYGILIWGGANKTNIKPLIQVQKIFF